jgi:frataxin
MSNRIASTLPRIAGRTFVNPVRRNAALSVPKLVAQRTHNVSASTIRTFTVSARQFKGIYPETDNPQTKDPEPEVTVSEPTPLTPEEYHENADKFIDHLVATLEELQESREDVDVEYSVSGQDFVLIAFPLTV